MLHTALVGVVHQVPGRDGELADEGEGPATALCRGWEGLDPIGHCARIPLDVHGLREIASHEAGYSHLTSGAPSNVLTTGEQREHRGGLWELCQRERQVRTLRTENPKPKEWWDSNLIGGSTEPGALAVSLLPSLFHQTPLLPRVLERSQEPWLPTPIHTQTH